MPDIAFEKLDQIPEGLREGVKEVDGKYVIKVVQESKLSEFRDNNTKLRGDVDTLNGKLARAIKIIGDEDLDKAEQGITDLRSTAQRVKDGELIAKAGLEEAVAQRTTEMRSSHTAALQEQAKEVAAWKAKHGEVDQRLKREILSREVSKLAFDEKLGIRGSAVPDLLERAAKTFVVGDDGSLKAMKGDQELYGDDSNPLTVHGWASKLREEAPHFFEGSKGGGSSAGNKLGLTASELAGMSPEQRISLSNERGR